MRLEPLRTGFAFASVIAFAHLVWAGLVAVGWAKPLLDFILWLHFLAIPVGIAAFDWLRAALLVGVTFAISFPLGALFAIIWNRLHRDAAEVAARPAG